MEHQERFSAVKGKDGGSIPDTGITLTVIGRVRGHHPQVILNRLDAKTWEILDISSLGDILGEGDEDSLLMYRWEGA